MSTRFFHVGKCFEVVTHPEFDETMDGRKQAHHMFPQGTPVVCTQVYPVGSNYNGTQRLFGLFEGQMEVNGKWVIMDQELSVTDVKVLKETN